MIPKYRAWHKTWEEMGKVKRIRFDDDGNVTTVLFIGKDLGVNAKIDEFELMQSTGLYDKNGKEIFEGDIVKRYRSPFFKAEWEYLIETVVREKASLLLGRDFGKNFGTLPFDSPFAKENLLEVIGNVHENPELLEEEE
nr:MAG TPA: YopX protein [Caudoviricetes sp.]